MKIINCSADLVRKTENPLDLVCVAGKRCTSASLDTKELVKSVEDMTEEEKLKLAGKILHSGHMSVLEHISYTFHIVCSRQCSHQLVRHRMASYSQLSQRYTGVDELVYIKEAVQDIDPKFLEEIEKIYNAQKELNSNMKKEDSRALLPNGISTAIMVTMNARELLHFFNERLCSRAQYEIRTVANKMAEHVDDFLKPYCMPKCISGKCNEFKKGCALGINLGLIKND